MNERARENSRECERRGHPQWIVTAEARKKEGRSHEKGEKRGERKIKPRALSVD